MRRGGIRNGGILCPMEAFHIDGVYVAGLAVADSSIHNVCVCIYMCIYIYIYLLYDLTYISLTVYIQAVVKNEYVQY
jgi:hypothetical protein